MRELPDFIFEFVGENWERLGLTPVLVFRLAERGFNPMQIDAGMKLLVGPDWSEVKVSVWIDRMIARGSKLMEQSLLLDEPPVIDVLTEELNQLFSEDKEMRICGVCGKGAALGKKKEGKFVCMGCLTKAVEVKAKEREEE